MFKGCVYFSYFKFMYLNLKVMEWLKDRVFKYGSQLALSQFLVFLFSSLAFFVLLLFLKDHSLCISA